MLRHIGLRHINASKQLPDIALTPTQLSDGAQANGLESKANKAAALSTTTVFSSVMHRLSLCQYIRMCKYIR
jgi:hypothetical protein